MKASLNELKVQSLIPLPAERESGRSNEQLLADDEAYVMRPWTGAGEPLPIVEAHGTQVRDADGKVYLDFTSGYFVHQAGHGHPRIIQAAAAQLHRVTQVSGRHATEASIGLAKELARLAPGNLRKTLFTTGGCESLEFAVKMARQASRKLGVLCLDNSFHGLSPTMLAACSNESYRRSASAPLDPSFVMAPFCYPYRGAGVADTVREIERLLDTHPDIGTLLAEPIQAIGGHAPPLEWWRLVDDLRRRRGLVLILDEVQTGLGRTGKMFAAEHYGLEPDIMTLAKGLSGGVGSLGAVMATDEIAAKFWGATSPTSAANAVSCAAGRALIEVILDEHLVERAAVMGVYLGEQLRALALPWIGDIRFTGLLGGVELVTDPASKTPISKQAIMDLKSDLLERGVIVTITGKLGNFVRIQPPLSVTRQEIDQFVAVFAVSLRAVMGAP